MSFGTKYEKGDRQGMKAAKAFSAPPANIKIIAGHNYRKIDPATVEMFREMYLAGKDVPPLLVAEGEDGGLELVDGEHRLRAALEAGLDKIPMVEFSGTYEERLAAAWRFNQGAKATATENATAFLRMRNNGWSNLRISKETGVSEGTVGNHLLLAMCGNEVMGMVDAGDVAATTVFNLARSIGPEKVHAELKKVKNKQPKKAATPSKKEDGKRLKHRKERVTEASLREIQKVVTPAALDARAINYLKALIGHTSAMMIVGKEDLEAAPDSQSITVTFPAKNLRGIYDLTEVILDFLGEQAKRKAP